MIIVDPVALGDVACTLASPKWVFDRTGTLVEVPADTLAVTYDPADLSKAPYALVELEPATNYIRNSTAQGGGPDSHPANWSSWVVSVSGITYSILGAGAEDGIPFLRVRAQGTYTGATGTTLSGAFEFGGATPAIPGETFALSCFIALESGSLSGADVNLRIDERDASNVGITTQTAPSVGAQIEGTSKLRSSRISALFTMGQPSCAYAMPRLRIGMTNGKAYDFVLRVGLPQFERDRMTSPIKTAPNFVSRSSVGEYWSAAGVLTSAAANVERVSYDPADLSAAPFKLWEAAAATNGIRNNTMVGAAAGTPGTLPSNWSSGWSGSGLTREVIAIGTESGVPYIDVRLFGTPSTSGWYFVYFDTSTAAAAASGNVFALSAFLGLAGGSLSGVSAVSLYLDERTSGGSFVTNKLGAVGPLQAGALNTRRFSYVGTLTGGATVAAVQPSVRLSLTGEPVDITIRIGLPQLERNQVTSPIKTSGSAVTRAADVINAAAVTRAADVIAAGAGLVYSNVPEPEPLFSLVATYAEGARVRDASHTAYVSLVAGNTGNPLADITKWVKEAATNRWAMLDQYNNTQTTNADEILLVVSPQMISQGLYLGNLLADEVRISVVDLVEGLVYSETTSLVESNSGSSFYNWCFRRIKRRDYFATLKMPPYANALVTISLRKIGGTAKCGMCALGPVDEFGPTLAGLSTEGKDYSSTTFDIDGTSSTVIRPYAKRMTCDVFVDNDQVDYLQARLFEKRQKLLVWFGGPYGSTVVAGRYGSFKTVFQYPGHSLMNLTIEGAV